MKQWQAKVLAAFLVFASLSLFAGQPQKIDSLKKALATADKKQQIVVYNLLSKETGNSDPQRSEDYARKAMELAVALQDKTGLGDAYNCLGRVSFFKGDYSTAIDHYMKSFIYRQEINDTVGMANSLSNIGVMYRKMNDFDKALQYYMQALELKEKLGRKSEVLNVLNNIGGLYYYQRNAAKALEYYNRTLVLATELQDSGLIAATYNNLSLINDDKMEYEVALEQALVSLEIRRRLFDLQGEAAATNNVGRIYEHMGETRKALNYYEQALKLLVELGDLPGKANTLYNMGSIYVKHKEYPRAISLFDTSLALAKTFRQRLQIRDNYHGLAHAWHYAGSADKSFDYFRKFIDMNDSIFNEESLEKISEMEVKYQSDRKARENEMLRHENELKDLKQENEHKKRIVITWASVAGLLVALFVVFLLLNRNKIRKKANEKLIHSRNEILRQKRIVEEKNKEITDSINYARLIQKAILPDGGELQKFFADSFVFFKPKDIVSGDFYWLAETARYYFYATVDCTGHGVPGGFMSMLGNSMLNEVVIEKGIVEPGVVLDTLRTKIIASLKQTGETSRSKDGMDMVLCRVSKDKKELVYAAANNPLWVIRNGSFTEYPASKQPVGISADGGQPFSQHIISLGRGDTIFTFTDGYADQFGGPKGKKFKYKQLRDLLLEGASGTMQQQKERLYNTFEQWRGPLEQVDDVLIIGIRL
jgi:serine phosphatase RsbU (regulator of sigma subunit)/Tfp pilus assembly protein PilF